MPSKIKIEFCTSCGSKEIQVSGQQYYCQDCDVTYKVTEAGTKVVDTNPLGKEKARLDQIEKDVADLKGKKPAEQQSPQAPEPDSSVIEKEEDEEPEGFITVEG